MKMQIFQCWDCGVRSQIQVRQNGEIPHKNRQIHTLNKKRRDSYRKCVQKFKKKTRKNWILSHRNSFLQQWADVPWGCLPNNAMINGEFILRFLFSSSPRWVKWFPQRCPALLTSQGERKKTWRMANNSPAGLAIVVISPSNVPTIMREQADTHNATMLPLNPYIIVIIISVMSSRGEGGIK